MHSGPGGLQRSEFYPGLQDGRHLGHSGGLLGGTWLAALTSDLGNGKFDGAWLVQNFENLNPSNTYWSKQYNLYSKIDTEASRYLGFERWWGGHVNLTGDEIQSIVDFIARQGKPSYEMEIHQQLSKPASSFDEESGIDEDEEIIQQCIEVIRSEQKASVSLLQRRLRLGYGRAARIMDELENRGIVGPSKGAEPRDILIDLDGTGADGSGQEAV